MRRLLVLALAFSSTGFCSALAADISGTWTIAGPITPSCTFTQTGNSLSGACRGPGAEGPLSGSIDGQTVKWVFTRTNMATGRAIDPVEFSGTLNGQSLSGTMTRDGGGNPMPFTAQFQPGAAPIMLASAPALQPLAAQQTQAPPAQSAPANAARPAINANPPKSVFDVDLDGGATHLLTGLACPVMSAGWRRASTIQYDQGGFDVSCGYRDPAGSTITIYISRHPPSVLNAVFDGAKKSIPLVTPGAVPRDDTAAAPPGFQWLSAGFSQRDGAVNSDLFLTQLPDSWEYQIRATYKPADMVAVNAATAELSDTLAKTAASHLAACAAAPPPPRAGQRNRDVDILPALSAATASTAKTTIVTPRSGAVWCAELGFSAGNASYIFWRNISPAEDGPVDRVTNVSGGMSDPVLVVRNSAALVNALVAQPKLGGGKHPADSAAIYGVVADGGASALVVGLFDGRPSVQEIADVTLRDRLGIYAEVKKPAGNVVIYKPF